MVELISMWENGEKQDHTVGDDGRSSHLHWLEETRTALEPFSLPGGYVNFLGPETTDQTANSYGSNTERLLAGKSAADPDSVFSAAPLPQSTTDAGSPRV